MLLRGGFRLLLGLTVAITVAYAALWLLDEASRRGALGSSTWWFGNLDLTLRLRALGPKLNAKR